MTYRVRVAPVRRRVRVTPGRGPALVLACGSDAVSVRAAGIGAVANPVPTISVAPVVSVNGTWATLACSTGTWTNSPSSYAYQWKRAGVAIAGATLSTYSTTGNDGASHTDYGPSITCEVIATNAGGSSAAAASNALAYTPSDDAANGVLIWLDPRTLTPGAVSSWVCSISGANFAQAVVGKRPTANATVVNGAPGVSFSGTVGLQTAANFGFTALGLTAVRLIFYSNLASNTTSLFFESGPSFSVTFGTFAFGTNFNGVTPYTVSVGAIGSSFGYGHAGAVGTVGAGNNVLSMCADTSVSNGVGFIRWGGAALSVTSDSATCGLGTFVDQKINLGARADATTFPVSGSVGHVCLLSGNAVNAVAQRVEQFTAYASALAPL